VSESEHDEFARLLAASFQTKRLERGQTIEGVIVAIGPDVAFVDVGGKGEATIELDELRDDGGRLEVATGDRIQATVVSTTGGVTLSRRLQRGAATAAALEDAYRAGLPVEGKVEGQVKGGYSVTVNRHRAFCPISQIDLLRDTDPASHLGRVYTFRIIEYAEAGSRFVVSRRALLEAEAKAKAEEVRRSLAPGSVVTGRVVSVRDFGAFLDLGGGVQGLLHVSEMGWSRVADVTDVAAPGQELTVKVLRIDEGTGQIGLSLKQLMDDPWATVPATFEVGQRRAGRVTRVADFGAFVELEAGIEGLAHASAFAPTGRAGDWKKTVAAGHTGMFEVLSIDLDKKRIGLAPVDDPMSGQASVGSRTDLAPGARVTGKVERHEAFGVFVFLAPGRTGLLPLAETGLSRDADPRKAFPVGSDITVIVTDVDAAGRRIRLSAKAVEASDEADVVREYAARTTPSESAAFGGSLADKLRGALGRGK
jgi:small subunit ribosomal protein S1